MAAKDRRIEMLTDLLRSNGIVLATDDVSIQRLNDWFRSNVEGSATEPSRLRGIWYSVVNDIGLFLGDEMIARAPGLRWEMFTAGKKNIAYQRHVVVGFTKVANRAYNVDPDWLVAAYAHGVVAGEPVRSDLFVAVLHSTCSRA